MRGLEMDNSNSNKKDDKSIDYDIEYEYLKEHDGIKTFNEILHPFHMKYEKNCPSKIARAFDYILCSKR